MRELQARLEEAAAMRAAAAAEVEALRGVRESVSESDGERERERETLRSELEEARGSLGTAKTELEALRGEYETLRGERDALGAECEVLAEREAAEAKRGGMGSGEEERALAEVEELKVALEEERRRREEEENKARELGGEVEVLRRRIQELVEGARRSEEENARERKEAAVKHAAEVSVESKCWE